MITPTHIHNIENYQKFYFEYLPKIKKSKEPTERKESTNVETGGGTET